MTSTGAGRLHSAIRSESSNARFGNTRFGEDRSRDGSAWQRILWGLQFVEDGPLYGE